MSRPSRLILPALAILALLLAVLPALAAREKGRRVDLISTVPEFASFAPKSIAMLPVVSFDRNNKAEQTVAALLGQSLRETGYRWISAGMSRDLVRSMLGDSVLQVVRAEMLEDVRVDSLRAPVLCARLRTDALLCVRVDQWEQLQVLWNQAGKPMTSIKLKAMLVDSSGALLWSASGGETGEGPYHDPGTNPIGVSSSNLENTPVTGQGGPPAYEEVLKKVLARWATQFPPVAAAADSTRD